MKNKKFKTVPADGGHWKLFGGHRRQSWPDARILLSLHSFCFHQISAELCHQQIVKTYLERLPIICHEQSELGEHSEVHGIKKGIKNFCP